MAIFANSALLLKRPASTVLATNLSNFSGRLTLISTESFNMFYTYTNYLNMYVKYTYNSHVYVYIMYIMCT